MKYKLNVRQKLEELDGMLMRLQYQMGRMPLEQQEETLQDVKEKLNDVKAMVESEDDDWKPKF